MPDETAIPLLGTCPGKSRVHKGPCSPVFAAALSTTTKTWKQGKCPSADEWMKRMRHKQTWTISRKKNEIILFAAIQLDLEMIIPSEGSEMEEDKYNMRSFMCGI